MKILKYAIFTFALGMSVSSCDFLDKEPTKLTPEVYFNTPEEAQSFLTGIYATLGQSTFYGGDYLHLAGGDDMQHYGGDGLRVPLDKGLICAKAVSSDPYVTGLWYTLYAGINRASMFLENIDNVTDIAPELKLQFVSEARFLRAFYYFTLVQNWGDVPFKTQSTNTVVNLDLPRTNRQQIYDFIIKEMAEAADSETGGLLPANKIGKHVGRISRSAAWATIARVYLFRAGEHYREKRNATQDELVTYFQEAGKYAQKVRNEDFHGLAKNYWDVFIDLCSDQYNTTADENIWEVEFAGNGTSDTRSEGRWGNTCGLYGPDLSNKENVVGKNDPGYSYQMIFATPKLYNLYEENGDFERFYWNLAQFKYVEAKAKTSVTGRQFRYGTMDKILNEFGNWGRGTYEYGENTAENVGDFEVEEKNSSNKNKGLACAKFRREYEADKKGKTYTSINFPLIRYSDVLLMIAEAENEVNDAPTELAKDCINEVRLRAGIEKLPDNLNKEEFRKAVRNERAMELCFELLRRYDLIRWGEFVERMTEIPVLYNNADEWKQITINPILEYFRVSDAYNYFPIPDQEMSVNKAIKENNPGW